MKERDTVVYGLIKRILRSGLFLLLYNEYSWFKVFVKIHRFRGHNFVICSREAEMNAKVKLQLKHVTGFKYFIACCEKCPFPIL